MSQRSRELTPHASVAHFFGAELRCRRLAAGLSLAQLGPRVLASAGLLNKVELAERFASSDLAQRCDAELEADGALVRLHGFTIAERVAARVAPSEVLALGAPGAAALLRLLTVAGAELPVAAGGTADMLQQIDKVLQLARRQTSTPANVGDERAVLVAPTLALRRAST